MDKYKRKKVLVLHPVIAPYRIDFFNELYTRFDAEICLFRRNLISQKFDYAKIEQQFLFKPTYIMESQGFFSWMKNVYRHLTVTKPDVVIVSEVGTPAILAIVYKYLTLKRCKVVSMVDDSYDMAAGGNLFSWKHKYAIKLLVPLLDELINVEPRVADYYCQKYGKGIFFPIIASDKVAEERLKQIIPISNEYISKYNLAGKKVLLYVGRLVKIKNLPFAINAFLSANIPDSVFVIVGDGEERGELESMAASCDNIIFTGRLEGDSLYAWYNVAQCFALPSLVEPFGAVTNEALQGGCKVLISNVAGSSCLVRDGANGYVIDPKDTDGFIRKLKSAFSETTGCVLMEEPRKNLMVYKFEKQMDLLAQKINSL